MFLPEELSLIVTSDPEQGAVNVSSDGSSFEVQLDDAFEIPSDALNVNLTVQEATVWWTVPNIITGQNDTLYIFGDDNQAIPVPQLFTVTIQQGLYDLTQLNNAIQSELENLGARTLDGGGNPLPLISLIADDATQKVVIRFNYDNVYVDFAPADTPREIMGFDAQQYGPFVGAPLNVTAPSVASFNTISYFLISSDLVSRGIRINNRYNQVVAQVLIDKAPGSQLISTPFNPPIIPSNELAGSKRTNMRFRLTDDKFRPVNTNGEYWTARILVKYVRPYTVVQR